MQNRRLLFILPILVLIGLSLTLDHDAFARRRSSSSRSYRSSSSYSRGSSSSSIFGSRSGGGIFGSSSSKSRSSSSKKSTSSSKSTYSKPSSGSTSSAPSSSSSSSSSSSKSTYSKSGSSSAPGSSSSFDKSVSSTSAKRQSTSSYNAYKAEQSKFKQSSSPSSSKSYAEQYANEPIFKNTKKPNNFSYDTHYSQRNAYYNSRGWSASPWVYASRPSFGMWDAMFLWMILDNIGSNRHAAQFAHNHANDPGYQEWRAEADKLAADNAELKAKLNELDKETGQISGPADPSYLPSDTPADVALSADALAAKADQAPVLRVATGSKSGNYYYFGTLLQQGEVGIDIQLLNTSGSFDNLKLLHTGKADAGLVQSDAFIMYKKLYPDSKLVSEQAALYPEAIQMIANRNAGVSSVKDINPKKHVLYIGPKGSGTAMTWEGLCREDASYAAIPVEYMDYDTALEKVANNDNAIMMFVSGLRSPLLDKAEAMAKNDAPLRLVAVDDWDFNDETDENGNSIYTFVTIPGNIYPYLQRGWLFSGAVETLAVEAIFVVRTEWVKESGMQALDALTFQLTQAQPEMLRRAGIQ